MKYLQYFRNPAKFLFMYQTSEVKLFPKMNTLVHNIAIRNSRIHKRILISKELMETYEEPFI